MLYVTVLVSGAVLMALEMLGSRVLAPYFGNSVFVWGSLIGVVLTALSAGYSAGGYLADRYPSPGPLALVVGGAGVWTWIVPEIAARSNPWIVGLGLDPRFEALFASLLLFAGPSFLLALVSPWAVRISAREIRSVGRTAGLLYALSTGGSIAGTLVTSFFLIPAFGVPALLRGLGLVLLALAAAGLAAVRRPGWGVAGAATLVLLLALTRRPAAPVSVPPPEVEGGGLPPAREAGVGPSRPSPEAGAGGSGSQPGESAAGGAGPGPAVGRIRGPFEDGVIYEKESLYHHIRVQNAAGSRYLRFDNSWQSGMYLDDPLRTRFEYTDYLLLPFAARPRTDRALLVGLGGGSVVKKLLAVEPELRLDVAEIDPEVVKVAREYFGVPENPRLTIHVEDGRQYLDRSVRPGTYDVILLDAYYADAIPFHLTTREFLTTVRSRLSEDGIVAANVIGALEGPRSALLRSMVRTFRTVFPEVYLFPVGNRAPTDFQNVILVAPRRAGGWEPEKVARTAEARAGALQTPALPRYARGAYTRDIPVDDVPVLTDEHAPVDQLLHLYD